MYLFLLPCSNFPSRTNNESAHSHSSSHPHNITSNQRWESWWSWPATPQKGPIRIFRNFLLRLYLPIVQPFFSYQQGSRGKRSIDTYSATTDDGNEASLKELSNLRDTIMGMQRNVRAPKGFFGMRGKKDYDMQVQEKRALLGVQQVR